MTDGIQLTAEDLLAGAEATYDIAVPPEVLAPGQPGAARALTVRIRPVTIGAFQLIMRAARGDAGLIPLLLIKEALAEPAMSLEQVKRMHLGLVNFLIGHIREISGLTEKKSP
ncbi:MAG TPA: hypothetical protein VGE07_05785 [Herpetosiphonaceae bacterium]